MSVRAHGPILASHVQGATAFERPASAHPLLHLATLLSLPRTRSPTAYLQWYLNGLSADGASYRVPSVARWAYQHCLGSTALHCQAGGKPGAQCLDAPAPRLCSTPAL